MSPLVGDVGSSYRHACRPSSEISRQRRCSISLMDRGLGPRLILIFALLIIQSPSVLGVPCDSDISVISIYPFIGSVISILSYSFIFYLYYGLQLPTLKRHPTSLAINKSFFELLYTIQFLWIAFVDRSIFYEDINDPSCRASPLAAVWSFISQFSLLGGEIWFLVLTMDLHLAITNPFTSYKLNASRYKVLVYGGSIGTAATLMLAGPTIYGIGSDSSIWIQVI